MEPINEAINLLSGLPPGVLVVVLVLAAFALAAYAIHAVLLAHRGKR